MHLYMFKLAMIPDKQDFIITFNITFRHYGSNSQSIMLVLAVLKFFFLEARIKKHAEKNFATQHEIFSSDNLHQQVKEFSL